MARKNWIRVAAIALASSLLIAASSAGQSGLMSAASESAAGEVAVFVPPPQPSTPELMRLRDGMAAADARDWIALATQRDGAQDPLIRQMLQWRYAIEANAPHDFDALSAALGELDGWPGRDGMRERAEDAIFASRLAPQQRIAFLRQEGGPISGDGRIALAQALDAIGQRREAVELARQAWREDTLGGDAQSAALSMFGDTFTSDDYAERVTILLWRGQRSEAARLLPRISPAQRLVADARIALQTRRARGLQAAVDAVPASLRDDPSLLYDRARYIRRTGRPERALEVAAQIDARQAPLAARDEIFEERRLYMPRALRSRDYRTAYALATNHGLSSGVEFADAEWLAGWISLRFLNNPAQAAEHFAHLDENVSSSVSSSRALYWRAQAARALGQNADADTFLRRAAQFPFTYYGQLASEQLGGGSIAFSSATAISPEVRTRFENRELVRALRAMNDIGTQRDFERIAFFLDDQLEDPQEIELLSRMARERAYNRTAVRNAKAGLFRGVVAPDAAYPLIDLPASVQRRSRPETALVLAIIRQESEFDHGTVSSANARGLMQLLPSTARIVARQEGLPYRPAALTTEPDYNMTLGSAYLGSLIDDFNGSYILAAAAYNAGPNRARQWIVDWGDPRSPSTDVVDWVELIPFSETRNYVQRVMENLQVYRHRLNGEPTPITLSADLRRGR